MSFACFRRRILVLLTFCAVALPVGVPAASRHPVAAEHGMVVTAHHLASDIGLQVLKNGGNAVDAAVAVGYALAVTYPAAGNLGGGGFMTIHFADGRETFLDFREKAPLAATATMYLDSKGNVIPGLSERGHKAVAVPGTVSGLEYAREKYGSMKRARLIAPAVKLAKRGFVLEAGDVDMLEEGTEDFRKDPASAAIFLDDGQPYEPGDRLVQKDLARTLELISRKGAAGFYQGETAAEIVAASKAGGGIIVQADLDRYATRELPPLKCEYRGYRIVSAPPPSSGGITLCEMLNVIEGYPIGALGYGSAQAIHYQIEAMRQAYFDRNRYLGDPAFVKNPVEQLLDERYAEQIRRGIDPDRARRSSDLGDARSLREGTHTTHYSIIDDAGTAVSVTYTLNDWFGARVTAAGTGVLLNNEMDDFTSKVGASNSYELMQGEPNAIAPGKTPLSSMTPTIVTRDGKPVLIVGSPGGSRIITAVMLTIVNVIDHGMTVQEAVDAPRFHQQWMPEHTLVEKFAVSPDTRRLLLDMGHKLVLPPLANHVAAILIGGPAIGAPPMRNNRYYGAIDPRRPTGTAVGY
jgi:gamma-glutamyltranspeptidase/glutathione hydrolase